MRPRRPIPILLLLAAAIGVGALGAAPARADDGDDPPDDDPIAALQPLLEVVGPTVHPACRDGLAVAIVAPIVVGDVVPSAVWQLLSPVFTVCGAVGDPGQPRRCAVDDALVGSIVQLGATFGLDIGLESAEVGANLTNQVLLLEDRFPAPLVPVSPTLDTVFQCAPVDESSDAGSALPPPPPGRPAATTPPAPPAPSPASVLPARPTAFTVAPFVPALPNTGPTATAGSASGRSVPTATAAVLVHLPVPALAYVVPLVVLLVGGWLARALTAEPVIATAASGDRRGTPHPPRRR